MMDTGSWLLSQMSQRLRKKCNVITHVEPTTDTGRTYRILPEEVIMQRKCTCMAEWDTLVMMKPWRREVVSSIPDRGTIVG